MEKAIDEIITLQRKFFADGATRATAIPTRCADEAEKSRPGTHGRAERGVARRSEQVGRRELSDRDRPRDAGIGVPYPAPEALVPIPTGIYASDAMAVAEPDTARTARRGADRRAVELSGSVAVVSARRRDLGRNCVLLKSSPLVPHVEAALRDLIAERSGRNTWLSSKEGGDVLDELLKRRFDSIFFTGGSKYGGS